MLVLRDSQATLYPIYFNYQSARTHGLPGVSETPAIVLIRDPIATAYSRYRVERDRWGGLTTLVAGPDALESAIAFTGHPGKLRSAFVWSTTRFSNFVQHGNRTFYRSGSNKALQPIWSG